jgi:hypothetical protein
MFAAPQVYYYTAFNTLATYLDPPSVLPRHQAQEFMRPRYVWYKMRVRERLAWLRRWFVLFGGLDIARISWLASHMQLSDILRVARTGSGGEHLQCL